MFCSNNFETSSRSNASDLSSNDSSTSNQQNAISLIINKLGHELEEIRERALENLISKLFCKILDEAELARCKQLFIKLFELFNFTDFKQHEKVLDLLLSLSNHEEALKHMRDIGGFTFLNALKNDLKSDKSNLTRKIDQLNERIIESLSSSTLITTTTLSTSASASATTATSKICSSAFNGLSLSDSSSSSSLSNETIQSDDKESFSFKTISNPTTQTAQNTHSLQNNFDFNQLLANSSNNVSEFLRIANTNLLTNRSSTNHSSFAGKTNDSYHRDTKCQDSTLTSKHSTIGFHQTKSVCVESFNFDDLNDTFSWVPLTLMDKQFLQTAENSLKSNDPNKIKSYCTFLQTIVFNDFPAEIFLQRSSIIKILIDLLIKVTSNSHESDDTSIVKCLINCLNFFCNKLIKRIEFAKDPSTFDVKDVYASNFESFSKSIYSNFSLGLANTKHQLNYNVKNQDNLNTSLYSFNENSHSLLSSIKSSTSDMNKMSLNKKPSNKLPSKSKSTCLESKKNLPGQSSRVSTPDSMLKESEFLIDAMPTHDTLNQDIQEFMVNILAEANIENYETDVNERESLRKSQYWPIHMFCFRLFDTLVDNISLILIKNNKDYLANNMKLNFQLDASLLPSIFTTVNNIIHILYETKKEWQILNLSETLLVLLSKLNYNIKMSHKYISELAEVKTLNVFNRIVYTYLVLTFYKFIKLMQSTHETSIFIPQEFAETLFMVLNDVSLVESFKNVSACFASILVHLNKPLHDVYVLSNEICESMRSACEFLMKCEHIELKSQLIDMAKKSLTYMDYHVCRQLPAQIVQFCSKISSLDDSSRNDVEYLVCSCMISKCDEIRMETFSCVSKLVNDSLNIQVATEVNSKRYKRINFLLYNKVFYQFITFGLFDKCAKVKKHAESINQHLLQCELLVPESFRLKLTQLIVIYMPFIQCLANQTEKLGQCIIQMSNDLTVPLRSDINEDYLKLFLSPSVERLRCSLRYLFSVDKNLRKKGFLQSIGFLTKLASTNLNDTMLQEFDSHGVNSQTDADKPFDLNEFYMKFIPDKFCDMTTKLKRVNRIFMSNDFSANQQTMSIFQTDNLLRVFNMFTSDTVDYEVKTNAGEQIAIMIATGDTKLHKAFINLDGVNYCIRYLKETLLRNKSARNKSNMVFLVNTEKENMDKIQASCISCLCHVFFWNKELRQAYLFDVDMYRLLFKALLVSYSCQLKKQENGTVAVDELYSKCQEDLTIIMFLMLYHQVSSLDLYYESLPSQATKIRSDSFFEIHSNLKLNVQSPIGSNSSPLKLANEKQSDLNLLEKQQLQAFDIAYKLNEILSSLMASNNLSNSLASSQSSMQGTMPMQPNEQTFKEIVERKLRLYWNFYWHGGSLLKLCNDLLYNESLIHTRKDIQFGEHMCLNEHDKCLLKYTNPFYLLKQLLDNVNTCLTHKDALDSLDLTQMLTCLLEDEKKFEFGLSTMYTKEDNTSLMYDECDAEFYAKHNLAYFFDRLKCHWHMSLNRFAAILPSFKSKSDQFLFCSSFQTIGKMLNLQSSVFEDIESSKLKMAECIGNSKYSIESTSQELTLLSLANTQIERANQSDNLDEINSLLLLDNWAFNTIYNSSSSLIQMIKHLLANYESEETRFNFYLSPLCEFVKVYFERLSKLQHFNSVNFLLPPIELLKICIEQVQACEIEKFRNLNKLSILMNLISSLLRVGIYSNEQNETLSSSMSSNSSLYIQLAKNLIQIVNTFNQGRGGLSLSFMGNFITKSAHTSLLQLMKNLFSIENQRTNKKIQIDIARTFICVRDDKKNIIGANWLIPLMLHREAQIRAISFSLMSLLVKSDFARAKLLANQCGIWSVALGVLLNLDECSMVRVQACSMLVNLTESFRLNQTVEQNESTISTSNLQLILHNYNFYQRIALTLASFYPFETCSFNELKNVTIQGNKLNQCGEELSICTPLLVTSICQLLTNLTIILNEEAILMINNCGIINLLLKYIKPTSLFVSKSKTNVNELVINEQLIDMLENICKYINLCCQFDHNCVLMVLKNNQNKKSNLINDLIQCLNIECSNKEIFKPLYNAIFELLSTLLNYTDDKMILEECLMTISKCWLIVTNYLLNNLLADGDMHKSKEQANLRYQNSASTRMIQAFDLNNRLFENALNFYSTYLSNLSLLSAEFDSIENLKETINCLYDSESFNEPQSIELNTFAQIARNKIKTIGEKLSIKIIKQFDKHFISGLNQSMKQSVSNTMKTLFALSDSAKRAAIDVGLIETLIEHMKHTHSKLNLKSLSSKGPLKENTYMNDLQQILLILKYLMTNSTEIKELVCKSGLHSIVHSLWCWIMQDANLLKVTLSTLCTLTANNILGVNLIAQSNISAQSLSITNEQRMMSAFGSSANSSSGISLLNSVIKSLQKTCQAQSKQTFLIQKYAFALLTNCVQSSECKSIIWKSNLLQEFLSTELQNSKSNILKVNFKRVRLWLSFLVALSFTQDGQQFFLKIDSLLPILLGYFTQSFQIQNQPLDIQLFCLLIFRNLALNSSVKLKLLSNSEYFRAIIQALRSQNERFHLLALSTIESLMFDCQKAKVALKNENVLKYLFELGEYYRGRRSHKTDSVCARILSNCNSLIKVLNE